jgi:hypothetical protein
MHNSLGVRSKLVSYAGLVIVGIPVKEISIQRHRNAVPIAPDKVPNGWRRQELSRVPRIANGMADWSLMSP